MFLKQATVNKIVIMVSNGDRIKKLRTTPGFPGFIEVENVVTGVIENVHEETEVIEE